MTSAHHTAQPDQSTKSWLPVVIACAIAVITWLVFSSVPGFDFISWDDNGYVYDNADLSKPLGEAILYFFGPHFYIGNYHPVTMTAYALLYRIAGVDPGVFHTANLLIHLLNVLLVFWFAWLLSGSRLIVATVTALFFGIHPMHVESVAWVAELKDVLYTAFFMAGLITYIKYTAPQNERRHSLLVATFLFFVLSALSKPAGIIFPVVLLVLDLFTGYKWSKRTWLEKLPFFIVAFVLGIVTIKAQHAYNLLHDLYPFFQRLLFASHSLLNYIAKFFVPFSLSNFYPYPDAAAGLPVLFYIAPVLVILLAFAIYRTLKYTQVVVFGCLFFLVTIVLELQLIAAGDAIMADRYTYVPYIGLLFIIGYGLDALYNNSAKHLRTLGQVLLVCVAGFALVCGYLANARSKAWRNNETIAVDLYRKYPNVLIAAHNMGAVLYYKGQFREAVPYFRQALRIKQDYTNVYVNLANAYLSMEESDSAFAAMESGLEYAVGNYNEYFLSMGKDLFSKGRFQQAAKFFNRYCQLQKYDPDGYTALARCYFSLKDNTGYINAIDSGLKYSPSNYNLLNHKGYFLFLSGKYEEAIPYFQAALKDNPNYSRASENLAASYRAIDSVKNRK
ncbi:MAG: hypothetical protein K0Q79_3173 [Flavipsychrobacter sp.]|jgi:tetratricopeptide (TPR) repeat protein|nr:hypothetical protein [Flavipsychrobacter sp.]